NTARNRIDDVLARVIRREPIGSVRLAKDANERGPLIDQRHDRLRLDRAVLDGIYNLVLNLRRGSAQCPDRAGVGHLYVPAGVDVLVGQRDEIAGPDTGFDRNKQAARGGLEDRDADAVSDAERDLFRGTPIGKYRGNPGRVACERIDDLRCDLDQSIRQACRVVGIPAAVNFTNLRPRGRHDGAAAAREGENAQNGYTRKMPRLTHNATPHYVDMLNDHIIRPLNEKTVSIFPQPLTSRKPDFYSSETPAGEGIGTPKSGTSIGPVGAIERKARVSARTDARASRSTWRVRSAFRTLTNVSHFLALTHGGAPIGRCLKGETSRMRNRENRGHHKHHVTHTVLPSLPSIDRKDAEFGNA